MVPIVPYKTSQTQGSQAPTGLSQTSKLKLQKAVRDFEAIFVNYMLQSMRKTVPTLEQEEGLGNDVMQGMFDLEMSRHISQDGSLGIAALMYKQLTGESMPESGVAPTGQPHSDTRPTTGQARGTQSSVARLPKGVGQYDESIQNASTACRLDPNLIKAVIAAESGGDARALSSKNAKGLMQLIDSTAGQMGVSNVWNPDDNILGGSKYLKSLVDKFGGNLKLAVAAYNAGPDTVVQHGGVPPIPETQRYVAKVMKYLHMFQEQEVTSNEKP